VVRAKGLALRFSGQSKKTIFETIPQSGDRSLVYIRLVSPKRAFMDLKSGVLYQGATYVVIFKILSPDKLEKWRFLLKPLQVFAKIDYNIGF
jgi:hypothetical protein